MGQAGLSLGLLKEPQTDYVTDNEITLPMYAALTDEQIDLICETVKKAVNAIGS